MLHSILKKNKNNYSEKIAIISDNKAHTYSDLWKDVNKIANWIDTNLEPNATVGLSLDNSYAAVVTIYGIVMSNRVCVPLDTDMHERNIKYIINDAAISMIVTSNKYLTKIEAVKNDCPFDILLTESQKYTSIETILQDIGDNDFQEPTESDITSTAFILYTTGTTGPKKGVILGHSQLLAATKNINQFMKIGSWAIENLPMRLSHSFGFARLRCVFAVGGTIILENGFLRPERILYNMNIHNANAISSVPAGFSILIDYFKPQLEMIGTNIRYIEIGSAFMRKSYKDTLMTLCPNARICMHYGLTEASRSTFIEFHSETNKLHTVGKPSPNIEIRIIDENGEELGPNQTGEILVKGQMVMKGYWNKDKLTKENLKNGWLHTGDLGKLDQDGYLQLIGRKKEIINIGGLKVAPGEVEEILLMYDGITEAAAVGMKSLDSISGEMIKAFIITDDNKLSVKDLEKFCLENMESYKLPSEFEIVESLPKTTSGKIQRHLLIQK